MTLNSAAQRVPDDGSIAHPGGNHQLGACWGYRSRAATPQRLAPSLASGVP